MAPGTPSQPETQNSDAANVVSTAHDKLERRTAERARENEEEDSDLRYKKKIKAASYDEEEIALSQIEATPETETTLAAPNWRDGLGEMEVVVGAERVQGTQNVYENEHCEHPSSYQKDEDADKSLNEETSPATKAAQRKSPTPGLESSQWAPQNSATRFRSNKSGPSKAQEEDLVTFLNGLYEEEERERHRTRTLMELLLKNVEGALRQPSEQAHDQGCQAVLDLTNDIKAFVKSSVVCSLKPHAVHVTRTHETQNKNTDTERPKGRNGPTTKGISDSRSPQVGPKKERKPQELPGPSVAGENVSLDEPASDQNKGTGNGQWTTVHAKRSKKLDHKKSYAAVASQPQHEKATPTKAPHAKTRNKEIPAINRRRVFVRLPENAPQRELHPLVVVQKVNRFFPVGKGIVTASTVRSGLSLSLTKSTSPEEVLAHEQQISQALGGQVEKDETYTVVKIRGVDSRMAVMDERNVLTQKTVSLEDDLYPDIERSFGSKPHSALWGEILEDDLKSTLRLTFSKEKMQSRPVHIALMGQRVKVEYPRARENKAPLCKRCWGQHFTKVCKGSPRCRTCGSEEHRSFEHPANKHAHCVNCGGQHPADSSSCPQALGTKTKRNPQPEPKNDAQAQRSDSEQTQQSQCPAPYRGMDVDEDDEHTGRHNDAPEHPVPWSGEDKTLTASW